MNDTGWWRVPTAAAPVRARVNAPTAGDDTTPDLLVAGAFAAAGLVTGGTVLVRNWPENVPAAEALAVAFADMGGYVVSSSVGLTVTGRSTSGDVDPVTIDLADASGVAPLLLVVASLAGGVSRFVGPADAAALAVVDNLRRLGVRVDVEGGRVTVVPGQAAAGRWESAGDVDVALAGLVAGLVVDGIELTDWAVVENRYRGFTGEWTRMLSADEYLVPGSDLLPHEYVTR
ncbi:hypothetical protein VZC37_13185 [Gordonia sp. LSe1-13]|uniref:Enolpyruvate transferase domain-containing protein n=1 Tax=Gordonia sesuvii TaxID=3116777 RepID=A0ABU7MDV7_9ACTN|nr:hypothetical protein [Gordonia sp. LSe1-13]